MCPGIGGHDGAANAARAAEHNAFLAIPVDYRLAPGDRSLVAIETAMRNSMLADMRCIDVRHRHPTESPSWRKWPAAGLQPPLGLLALTAVGPKFPHRFLIYPMLDPTAPGVPTNAAESHDRRVSSGRSAKSVFIWLLPAIGRSMPRSTLLPAWRRIAELPRCYMGGLSIDLSSMRTSTTPLLLVRAGTAVMIHYYAAASHSFDLATEAAFRAVFAARLSNWPESFCCEAWYVEEQAAIPTGARDPLRTDAPISPALWGTAQLGPQFHSGPTGRQSSPAFADRFSTGMPLRTRFTGDPATFRSCSVRIKL